MMTNRMWRQAMAAVLCGALVAMFSGNAMAEDAKVPVLNKGGIDQAGGTIKGIVKFNGKQAKRKPIQMDADKFCATEHASGAEAETFVFGDNDTLQNVFVYVSKGLEGKTFPAPTAPALIDQHGCTYVPHVLGVVVGQPVVILNSDATLHNVNCKPTKNKPFNQGMPVKGMKLDQKFSEAELSVPLKCDVHPWMGATLHVLPHPFFAVTQQDGTFTITGLPAGKYEVTVVHEFSRFAPDKETQEVEVADGKTAELTFTYAPKAAPAAN